MINRSLLADGKLEAIGPKKLHDLHGEENFDAFCRL